MATSPADSRPYDLAVIGAGPAGLAAAVTSRRRRSQGRAGRRGPAPRRPVLASPPGRQRSPAPRVVHVPTAPAGAHRPRRPDRPSRRALRLARGADRRRIPHVRPAQRGRRPGRGRGRGRACRRQPYGRAGHRRLRPPTALSRLDVARSVHRGRGAGAAEGPGRARRTADRGRGHRPLPARRRRRARPAGRHRARRVRGRAAHRVRPAPGRGGAQRRQARRGRGVPGHPAAPPGAVPDP